MSRIDDMAEGVSEINRLRAEVERLQAELVDLRALADKRTRDERDGWCEREGECWLMDGPCAGHDRHREGPMIKNIAADDSRIAEREEEMHATISDLRAEVERLREENRNLKKLLEERYGMLDKIIRTIATAFMAVVAAIMLIAGRRNK